MATLRHPYNFGHVRVMALTAVRRRSRTRAALLQVHHRAQWLRSTGHVLLIGRDLLFALWAIAVFAFWVAIVVGLVL